MDFIQTSASGSSVFGVTSPASTTLKISSSPRYGIDWTKVTSLNDVRVVLEALAITVQPGYPSYAALKPYLKDEPEPPRG